MISKLCITLLLFAISTAEQIGSEVMPPTVFTLAQQTHHHDLVVGQNQKQLKPDVKTPVYSWKVLNSSESLQNSNAFCMVSRPDLKNKVDYQGSTQIDESIQLVLPVREHKRIYALTRNGTFIKYHNSHGKVLHQSQIKVNAKTNSSTLLFRGNKGNVYLMTEGSIFKADIKNDTLKLQPLLKADKQPLKAIEYDGQFVLLYSDEVHIWPEKPSPATGNITKHLVPLSLLAQDFIDMAGSETNIFLLSRRGGVAVLSLADFNMTFYKAKVDGYFSKISVYGETIQLLYYLQKHNYVAQLFYNTTLGRININRIYRVMFGVHDFVLFEGVGVLLSDRVLYYIEHSLNRNTLEEDYQEILYKELVFGAHKIAAYSKNEFVVVFRDHIKVVSIKHLSRTPILNCVFEEPGDYNISVEYKLAHCKPFENASNPQNSYCLQNVTYTFTVRTVMSEITHIGWHVFMGMVTGVFLLLILTGFRWCQGLLTIKRNRLDSMRRRHLKRFEQGSAQQLPAGGEEISEKV